MTIRQILNTDEKWQKFLLLLQIKIELQGINPEKDILIKYKDLMSVFDNIGELKEYLQYAEKNNIVKIDHISKKKFENEPKDTAVYISETKFDRKIMMHDEFWKPQRYFRYNYYPEDLFIFNYDLHKIRKGLNIIEKGNSEGNGVKYITKDNLCFLQINNREIKIGNANSRKCKLLKCLMNPFGIAKTVEIIFGEIQLPKDKNNQNLWSE